MPQRGRPRLTPSDYEQRLQSYCARYAVAVTPAGIPPFPTGQRETDQHREWMSLYRVHSRLGASSSATMAPTPDGACPVCCRVVEPAEAVPHRSIALHPACHAAVAAVEPLGAPAFERLGAYLWPDQSTRSPRRQRKPGSTSAPSR